MQRLQHMERAADGAYPVSKNLDEIYHSSFVRPLVSETRLVLKSTTSEAQIAASTGSATAVARIALVSDRQHGFSPF